MLRNEFNSSLFFKWYYRSYARCLIWGKASCGCGESGHPSVHRLYKYSICCQRTALHFWIFAAVAFASDKHADPACPSHPRQETCYNIMLVKEASGYAPHPGRPALLWQRGGVGDIFLLNQLCRVGCCHNNDWSSSSQDVCPVTFPSRTIRSELVL